MVVIFLAILIIKTHSLLICDENDFCPPQPIASDSNNIAVFDDSYSDFIQRDNVSGCYCRLYQTAMTCFGRSNCKKVPKVFVSPKKILVFHTSALSEVKYGDFEIFKNVSEVYIEFNNLLVNLEDKVFEPIENLTYLSISHNVNLRSLNKGVFYGCKNLQKLLLIGNGFNNIHDAALALQTNLIPNLKILSFKNNNFEIIQEDSFASLYNSTLTVLNMVLCRIDFIHPRAFLPLKNLESLKLGFNSFNESTITDVLNTSIQNNIPLKNLNFYSAGFVKTLPRGLMEVLANSQVNYLNLSKNRFEVINKNSFPVMPSLKVLDLAEVLALSVTKDAFVNFPNLRTLILSFNKFSEPPKSVLLENITYLDLQQNSGSVFFSSAFTVSGSRFKNMKKLIYLNLGYNKLDALYEETFLGLENLKFLGLKNGTIRSMSNYTFATLKKLEFLNLENNYFVKNNPVGIENDIFTGLDNLRVLLLGGNYISFIAQDSNPFKGLKSLIHLDLNKNEIIYLTFADFGSLIHLKQLDLSYNSLTSWTSRIFKNNTELVKVNLFANKIPFITKPMLEDFQNLDEVVMNENPIMCECNLYTELEEWFENNNESLFFNVFGENQPRCSISGNVTVMDFIDNVKNGLIDCNSNDLTRRLYLILPLVFILLIFLGVGLGLFYYRHHVRYWLFLTRLYLSRKGKISPKPTKENPETFKYDAFVSYSSEDTAFITLLVKMLEKNPPHLNLCIYERDFEIGTFISENVLENVSQSRKTLLIISENYAKSQWCRWETQIAHHHKIFFQNEKDDSLVLIKYGHVSNTSLTSTLKYLLKTRIYLQWDEDLKKQKDFWEKLGMALKPNIIVDNTQV
ncbi:unnamed protein product [Brassicogethes aeneus]|uniref:TIR domain-containing protein n=1 Tax=Brassicogethes aeneus TaxID=1431903 RepID=A0A9P0FPE7_BRAAE|nr:unnamed protein product [Brassicogethes aeneus]